MHSIQDDQSSDQETAGLNHNPMNVYTGPESLRHYFDPDKAPPLPLVEFPPHLNPYYDDGVRIYAKMMSCHPANNVKSMPAMNLLENEVRPDRTKTIVEYSSGSTVISMSMVARVFHGIEDTRAFLSNKTSAAKLKLMQFFGLKLTLFGGPSQPEPTDPRGGIQQARALAAESDEFVNPNQYENDNNWKAHVRWTGPQILKQLPEINIICGGMGTAGTMTGLGTYFNVCTAAGDRVPGPRSYSLLAPVEFPWREAVQHIEHVGSFDSFTQSLKLCRNGLICGPSSGFNLQGLLNHLEKRKRDGTLREVAGNDGVVHAVFLCCDLPYQYIDEYFGKLGSESFPEIQHEHLTKVDLYRYDEAWELDPSTLSSMSLDTLIIDSRQPADFHRGHLNDSLNIPLRSSHAGLPSPFSDPNVLEQQWIELNDLFGQSYLQSQFAGRRLMCICYDGDTSRVATSVLRAKGFEAESIRGGYEAVVKAGNGKVVSKRDSGVAPAEEEWGG